MLGVLLVLVVITKVVVMVVVIVPVTGILSSPCGSKMGGGGSGRGRSIILSYISHSAG